MAVRSGADAIIHYLRMLPGINPNLVIIKIDGISAFDHIYRSSIIAKLYSLPQAKKILPFVLLSYGATSQYIWSDSTGIDHVIAQSEGGEQGDVLMSALFCLGLHDALHEAKLATSRGRGDRGLFR